ncbi:hypothetical protein A2Z33_02560 [Candidatus Gottesmanbacteria bacterium RBG_16_52_11]|uniref:Uncharacterized protein n=1 Tax=Candidatus Gottesmanbacteria bacterium RBG_16_52_11 TaxID=1798374 RepID=A0A1F5YMH3_9BACT|nr:MAG: hypothetical protein A2Z33_02560 [Candidatus Gottesmanbacteria bacterium RBG_16_52_11]
MAIQERNGIIQGSPADIAEGLSDVLGTRIFPGDEDILKHPNILGVQAGTHRFERHHDLQGRVHLSVVPINSPSAGDEVI